MGRTVGLAISALIGCWCISVPMSYVLGIYLNFGIKGIWYGIIMGYTIFASSTFIIFFRSNWEQCAENAVRRNMPENDYDVDCDQAKDMNHGQESIQNKDGEHGA